jgi:transposase
MSSKRSSPNCSRATSSSWTICPPTRSPGCGKPIETAGASLKYLPPYSPDFNPIEMAFVKLKSLLRAAAARTIPDLWKTIADALRRFTPLECANYLAAAGYDAT